jgi:hypothetical protein
MGFWLAALVVGNLLAAGMWLVLLPVLDDQVRLHATSYDTSNWGYAAVRVVLALVSAMTIAVPTAFVLGRWLHLIEPAWIAASAVAALIALGIPVDSWFVDAKGYLMQAPGQPSLVVAPLISGAIAGCVFGIAQAIVLKPYIRGWAWWIPASMGARALAGVATSLVTWQIAGAGTRFTTSSDAYVEEIAGALIGSLIVGIVTGLTLVRLLGELSHRELTQATI